MSLLEKLDDIDKKIASLESNIKKEFKKGKDNNEESKKSILDTISKTSNLKNYDELLYKQLNKYENSVFKKVKDDVLTKIKVRESPEFVKKIAEFFVNNKFLIMILFVVVIVLVFLSMSTNVTIEKIKTNLNE